MRNAILLVTVVALAGCGGGGGDVGNNMVTTESGLKYAEVKEGEGDEAKKGTLVSVHYTGTLASNGKKFDSSHDRGEPIEFELGAGEVIKGWDEGVAGMKVGGKRKLTIPAKLGYGARGAGRDIPPNADLNFDVELVKVTPLPPLKTEDIKVGTGAEAKAGKTVVVHYTGTLASNGKKFDSSHDRQDPIKFELGAGEVIKGWDQGVAGMKVGGKRKLMIPSRLGYGRRGAGPDIPPNADLVFEVELLKVID